MKPMLTQAEVMRVLQYEPATGEFMRLWSRRSQFSGRPAGNVWADGYAHISIRNVQYLAHRLAWLYVTGEWPTEDIDHINRVRSDNRFKNLRAVPRWGNLQNQSLRKDNKTGVSGVFFNQAQSNWHVQIGFGGKRHCLGHFKTFEEAVAVRNAAKARLHAFDPRHARGDAGAVHALMLGANPAAAQPLTQHDSFGGVVSPGARTGAKA